MSETSVYLTSPHGVLIYYDIYNCFLRNTDTVHASYNTSLHLILWKTYLIESINLEKLFGKGMSIVYAGIYGINMFLVYFTPK